MPGKELIYLHFSAVIMMMMMIIIINLQRHNLSRPYDGTRLTNGRPGDKDSHKNCHVGSSHAHVPALNVVLENG